MLAKSDFTSQSQWKPRRCLTLIEGAGGLVRMRKERRQGRIVFLILLVALGFAVMLLVSHLHL